MDTEPLRLGTIASLWRYPVKSMQGEQIVRAVIGERGLLGDRAYALLDRASGHIVSAKHPRKWGAVLACRAAFAAPPQPGLALPPVWISLPNGRRLSSAQPDIDQQLSSALGRAVSLLAEAPPAPTREANRAPIEEVDAQELIREESMGFAAPSGTFFDYAPLHLLTTATLDRLQQLHLSGHFAIARFRPNIVVAPDTAGFVENTWLGRALRIGAHASVELIDPCPRCVVTTLAQGELPQDPAILRTVSQHNAAASVTLAPAWCSPPWLASTRVCCRRG